MVFTMTTITVILFIEAFFIMICSIVEHIVLKRFKQKELQLTKKLSKYNECPFYKYLIIFNQNSGEIYYRNESEDEILRMDKGYSFFKNDPQQLRDYMLQKNDLYLGIDEKTYEYYKDIYDDIGRLYG